MRPLGDSRNAGLDHSLRMRQINEVPAMPHFTIRYSSIGTGVLRAESVKAEDALAAVTLASRRLGGSQTFSAAEVADEVGPVFHLVARPDGVSAVEAEAAGARE